MADNQAINRIDLSRLPGILVVISGPAGSGKNTIVNALLAVEGDRLWESVSCTTREMRKGEADGEHYHKMTRPEFLDRVQTGYFLEHAEFSGNLYGTPLPPIQDHLSRGIDVLLIVEVQGAALIRQLVPNALTIFVMPEGDTPAEREQHLRQRLNKRGTDSAEQVDRRVQIALSRELPEAVHYQHQITNRDGQLADTARQLHAILETARAEHAEQLSAV